MNNDLISRKAVIKGINELIESPYANSPQFGPERRECMGVVKELCANSLPAAYNMEKVIEQINAATGIDGLVFYVDGRPVIYKEKAIELIRQGGQQPCAKD